MQKVVVSWMRLNSGMVKVDGKYLRLCPPGTADIVAYLRLPDGVCHVLFLECKRSEGGTWGYDQQEFAHRFINFSNVSYDVVRNPQQVDELIENITHYNKNKLNEITF